MRCPMARLAFLLPNFVGGGAERVALTLIEGLVERGHQVDLLLAQAVGELLPLVPASVRVTDLKAPRMRHVIWPLARYLRRNRPLGLLALMWPMPVLAVSARFLARSKTRIVTSDHGILSNGYRGKPGTLAALRLTVRLLYPLAEARVTASAAIADDLADLSGLQRQSITVITNPIPVPDSIISNEDAEAQWEGTDARILTVGSLKPAKNHALLLAAFAELAKSRDARLIILGEGAMREELEQCARRLGIADRVRMPGFRTDPWPYYASADLFVLSSDTEGFGNVLVEAMAAGLPVVSTDCAGPREVLDGGKYGQLVPIGDASALRAAMEKALDECPDTECLKDQAAQYRPDIASELYRRLLIGASRA